MAYLVGAGLALTVAGFAALIGLDRDRGFYPTVLMVVASYYILFAATAGSGSALLYESLVLALFVGVAAAGFRLSLWFVVLGLAAHGLFDWLRGGLIANPGVPAWWPSFCLAFDLAAAACLAFLLSRQPGAEARPFERRGHSAARSDTDTER
ncbi:MAG TPA: hypothetical protein VGX37_04535 [Allosphingosinicella sp.]|jgi:hypothetical protein|nr:hypothetical protein [Allosphingosinicella sp.]